jgi:hypothetical protein
MLHRELGVETNAKPTGSKAGSGNARAKTADGDIRCESLTKKLR